MLDYAISPWVCCIMVKFSHVFCWIERFEIVGFTYVCNGFLVSRYTLSFILCYNIHGGPFCIVKVLHAYVALWLCLLIDFVGL